MGYRQLYMETSTASIDELLALALALGAREVAGWSAAEEERVAGLPPASEQAVVEACRCLRDGQDVLGDLFTHLLSAEERRPRGATYTPPAIVEAMLDRAASQGEPARVIDPGTGSGRFLAVAARRFPRAYLVGVENDPAAAILARGHLAALGLTARARVIMGDYLTADLGDAEGRTLFIGNPPYVRHHQLGPATKAWLVSTARSLGVEASRLAGLHVHFFLATARRANPGDSGVFITAAEWLDVNYGRALRELLLGVLGVSRIQLIEPRAEPFPGTATTAVIAEFTVGALPPQIIVSRAAAVADLVTSGSELSVCREQLAAAPRWSPLTRGAARRREGFVELGELCRVHRGQVTGANRVWIAGPHSQGLPTSVLYPTVTRARELIVAGEALRSAVGLRLVIDLPPDLDALPPDERGRIEAFLAYAAAQGAEQGYIARNRRAWWSVGLRPAAPILATYMARRPPVFVRNLVAARHINIAHGLYPRVPLSATALTALTSFLNAHVSTDDGRTYAGGLTKFEPREMERLLVPHPELLEAGQSLEVVA